MKYHDTVEEGLDFFDPEGRVFPKIAAKVANGLELSKQDILLILKWKLGRLKESNKGTIADNKMKVINSAIKDAGKDDSRIAALTALDGVPEIGLAVATAILTVCYPEKFTIIDWRVLEVLDLFPSRLPKAKRKEHSTNHWTAE